MRTHRRPSACEGEEVREGVSGDVNVLGYHQFVRGYGKGVASTGVYSNIRGSQAVPSAPHWRGDEVGIPPAEPGKHIKGVLKVCANREHLRQFRGAR